MAKMNLNLDGYAFPGMYGTEELLEIQKTDVGAVSYAFDHDYIIFEDLIISTETGGGGTVLNASQNDYEPDVIHPELSNRLTAYYGARKTACKKVKVLNSIYQTGDLFHSGKYVADVVTAEDISETSFSLTVFPKTIISKDDQTVLIKGKERLHTVLVSGTGITTLELAPDGIDPPNQDTNAEVHNDSIATVILNLQNGVSYDLKSGERVIFIYNSTQFVPLFFNRLSGVGNSKEGLRTYYFRPDDAIDLTGTITINVNRVVSELPKNTVAILACIKTNAGSYSGGIHYKTDVSDTSIIEIFDWQWSGSTNTRNFLWLPTDGNKFCISAVSGSLVYFAIFGYVTG